ncbi:MAG: bacteriohemerythrin [Methylococcaceae bacterium]|nr:bacteriohemerythrin [Methylococcaceae bacterium]
MTSIDIFPWDDNFKTGLAEVDEQHRCLIGLLNDLASHVASDDALSGLEHLFDQLADYADYHFGTEEAIWHRYLNGDPDEKLHRDSHAAFVKEVARLRSHLTAEDRRALAEETLSFLARWLASHILESDRWLAYAVLALQAGASPAEAKVQAKERMSGSTRALIDIILSIYSTLSANTLRLMRELGARRLAAERLQEEIEAHRVALGYRRALLDNFPYLVWLKDTDGRFLAVNKALAEIWRQPTAEALVGKTDYDFSPPELAERYRNDDLEVLASGVPKMVEEPHMDGDRQIWIETYKSPVLLDGEAIGTVGFARDITHRRRYEEELVESRKLLQTIVDSLPVRVFWKDRELRYLGCNPWFAADAGKRSVDEVIGRDDYEMAWRGQADRYRADDRRVIDTGRAEVAYEEPLTTPDGRNIWVRTSKVPLAASDGSIYGVLGIYEDITERKLADEVVRLRQRLSDMVLTHDLHQVMQTALDAAEQLTESQIGFFHFVEKDQETVSLQTWSTRTLKEMCYAKSEDLHYPVSEAGVWVDCIHRREPVIHNDYAALGHRKGLPEGHAPVIRELTVPVFREQRIVAAIGVGNKPRDYDEKDVELVSRLADLAYDFVERKQAAQQVQFMAFNDVLTGLPNRQLFADRLHQAISLCKRSGEMLAICYLDLDGFKPINDRHGHEAGDQLLVELGKRLQQELRAGDTLARLGGDEFVVLLNQLSSFFAGEQIVERILRLIVLPFEVEGHRLSVSASIGVTFYPQDDGDPDTLLRHADQAMYKAKELGKNTFKLYDPVEDRKADAFRSSLAEFQRALHESELILHYQPRIDLASGDLAGVEALVRWQHPEKGLLQPGAFLPLLKDSPLEIALDEWVLKAAIEQHVAWRALGLTVAVSVNISPRYIQQAGFVEFLRKLLSAYPDDLPNHLELEVLETSALGDTASVADIMNACSALGVSFSLDDFGTGYSSLTYFHRLPISIVKIDQNFVRGMMNDPRDQDIVEGVLHLAKALDRPVVAEGVETIELGLMLAELGCHYAQGYGIARPIPPERLPGWAEQWTAERIWHDLRRQSRGPTPHYDLNVAIFTHGHWLSQVLAYLQSGLAGECPELDEANCQFAQWYRGIGATRYGSRARFAFILAKHDEAHRIAQDLVHEMRESGLPADPGRLADLTAVGEQVIAMVKGLTVD